MNTNKVYLNAYMTEWEYGGPEEGGWYYPTYEPAAAIPIVLKDGELKEELIDLDAERGDDPFRYNIFLDVPDDASDDFLIELGWYKRLLLNTLKEHGWGMDRIITRWETLPAQVAPTPRPHYE
mgnify:CR=1 FL=1